MNLFMRKTLEFIQLLFTTRDISHEDKHLYRVITVEMFILMGVMSWFVFTDIFVTDILPEWVSVFCIITFSTFTYGAIRQNDTLLKTSVILTTSLLTPFIYSINPNIDEHRIGSLLLPAAVALLIDGWYWILGGTIISSFVYVNHVGIANVTSIHTGDYIWFSLILLLLITTRVMTDLTLRAWQNRTVEFAENTALLEMLTNSVDAGLIVADLNLNVFIWNNRMVAITGIGMSEIQGVPLYKVSSLATMEPAREDQVRLLLDRVLQGETISVPDAIIPFPRVGTQNWYSRTYAPHYNGYHQIIGIVESVRDVTKYHLDAEIISNLNKRLMSAYDTTLTGWVKALDMRDEETEGHSRRVTLWAVRLARKMNLPEIEIENIRRGALLHDIGKLAIPDAILQKPSKLDANELAIMRTHPDKAYDMLRGIEYLDSSIDIPHYHHEKWDGSGYPKGLKEHTIPLSARIFSIIDVFDALTSDRPYRKALAVDAALEYITSASGKHFDPDIVIVFINSQVWNEEEWQHLNRL